MKGQSELTATFVKLIQIGLVIVGALAIFFTYIQYEINVNQNSIERETYYLGNALLSSNCLTDGTKGVLVKSKIENFDKTCFSYPGKFRVTASDFDSGEIVLVSKSSYTQSLSFEAVLLDDGKVEPAKLEVIV